MLIAGGLEKGKKMKYTHKKSGDEYIFLAHGIDTTNSRDGEQVAIYFKEDNEHLIFVRNLEEFERKFEISGKSDVKGEWVHKEENK